MATAQDPDAMKQVETLLQCCLCTKTLHQPRTLSCYHSFCKHCLENYIVIQTGRSVEAGAKVPDVFVCPVCRTSFSVKGESIGEKMLQNHFINNLLELLVLQQQAQRMKCQSCKADTPASSRCTMCETFLCTKCLEAHNNWPAFETHVVLTLDELAKPENLRKLKSKPRCDKHDKVLKFYCETCKVLVCRYCVDLSHQRPRHNWFPLTDVLVQYKEALKASSCIFEQQKNDAAESNRNIQRTMETLMKNAAKAKDAIRQQQQMILSAFAEKLEKETTALLDLIDMKCKESSGPLLKQQADVKAYFEKAKRSLEFAKNVLASGSDEVILGLKHDIVENGESIVNERPKVMEPVHDGLLEYHLKPTKDIIDDLKLNDLGIIVYRASKKTRKEQVNVNAQSICERSTILEGNMEHAKQLVEWVEDRKFTWKLCYRASRDGWKAEDFHRKCDDVGPTVTLVKCGTSIFGGFTDRSWKPSLVLGFDDYRFSKSSFLFSLRNKENLRPFKCPISPTRCDMAIYCYPACGAVFGGGYDLYIENNAITSQRSFSKLGNTYQPPRGYKPGAPKTKALLAGSYYFTPSEIEVFCS